MYFGANSRCRIENSVEKATVFLHPLYIIGLKIVPRENDLPNHIFEKFEIKSTNVWIDFKFDVHSYTKV